MTTNNKRYQEAYQAAQGQINALNTKKQEYKDRIAKLYTTNIKNASEKALLKQVIALGHVGDLSVKLESIRTWQQYLNTCYALDRLEIDLLKLTYSA